MRRPVLAPAFAAAMMGAGQIESAAAQARQPQPVMSPQVDPTRPEWENPAINAIGKEPARATGFA